MANIKSAKKRIKVIEKKTLENKMQKTALKTAIKKFLSAVGTGDKAQAEVAYTEVVKSVDHAASYGIIHKNNAARKKSRFTLMMNSMK